MTLLRLISWPYIRKHLLRSVLTTAGIVLGVAIFVAMHTANQSVTYAFGKTVDRIAGATQLQVSAGDTGFDEEVLERVQSVPSVRVAVPVIEATVNTGLKGQGNLLILGVDMTGDRSLRDYDIDEGEESVVDDPLVFLAQPDSIIVTREFAGQNHLGIDSRLPLRTMEGEKTFVVRGIMKSGGLSQAFGGNLALMDIYAAQKVFGRGRKFDRIDIAVQSGVKVEQCQADVRRLLGPGFEVDPPSGRGEELESMLAAYSTSATITSLMALLIGIFIIYNSFAIAVTQRRYEIGVLRALGATRKQIRFLFLVESAMAGLLGSIAGIALGILMARGMAGYIGGMIEGIYGVAQRAGEVSSDPRLIAFAASIGIVTSVIAAWIPARNAAGVDPVHALQKGKSQVPTAGENRLRRRLALAVAAGAIACPVVGPSSHAFYYAGYFLSIIAALLLAPSLSLWLARGLRPLAARLRPVEGTLAADSLIESPRRTSGTVAALMLSLAIIIGFGGLARGSYKAIDEWCQATLNPDFFIMGSENIASRQFRFPASMADQIRAIPGVEEVERVRNPRIVLHKTPVTLVAVELNLLQHRIHKDVAEGQWDDMFERAHAGKAAFISENLANLQNVHLGDTIDLPVPSGTLRLPVAGVVRDYSDQRGTVFIDRSTYVENWHDDTVNVFRVYVTPGADRSQVRSAILDKFAGQTRLFVFSNDEVRKYVMKLTDQWNALSYIQVAVGVLVAILGIANSLTVSIIDRRRELGVLQAVGGLRNQIRGTIWMEALSVALIGLVLGLLLGVVNLYYTVDVVTRDISGFHMAYVFPYGLAAALLPIMLGAAFISSLWPAESAVRASLVEALEYE